MRPSISRPPLDDLSWSTLPSRLIKSCVTMSGGKEEGLGGVTASKVGMFMSVLLTEWKICELLRERCSNVEMKETAFVAGNTATISIFIFWLLFVELLFETIFIIILIVTDGGQAAGSNLRTWMESVDDSHYVTGLRGRSPTRLFFFWIILIVHKINYYIIFRIPKKIYIHLSSDK